MLMFSVRPITTMFNNIIISDRSIFFLFLFVNLMLFGACEIRNNGGLLFEALFCLSALVVVQAVAFSYSLPSAVDNSTLSFLGIKFIG